MHFQCLLVLLLFSSGSRAEKSESHCHSSSPAGCTGEKECSSSTRKQPVLKIDQTKLGEEERGSNQHKLINLKSSSACTSSSADPSSSDICSSTLKLKDNNNIIASLERKMTSLVALEFEVFGKVQGVFFRKFTASKGKELGLRGWCKNTEQGTVIGEIEGPTQTVMQMKEWLTKIGSPKSKISKAEFRNERNVEKYKFNGFDIRK